MFKITQMHTKLHRKTANVIISYMVHPKTIVETFEKLRLRVV